MTSSKIQSREYSKDGDLDDIPHIATLGRERELERRERWLEPERQLRDESEQVECREPGGLPQLCSFSHPRMGVFVNPFFQPPNSLPISSITDTNSENSLVLINLFSQDISERNLILLRLMIILLICSILFSRHANRISCADSSDSMKSLSILSPIPNRSGLEIFLYNFNQHE